MHPLTRQYRFFHWHVEFPHIFRVGNGATDIDPATGWSGGFSCVMGNPPCERVKLQEQEFFASRRPDIADAANASVRKKLITDLNDSDSPTDQALYSEFQAELRRASGWSFLLRESGRYPLTGRGDINTYAVFAETARTVIASRGRSGLILPTGIVTDATTAPFFANLVIAKSLASVYDFENEEKVFPAIGNKIRFCLLTIAGRRAGIDQIRLAFRARQVRQIDAKLFTLNPDDISKLNPNTLTCPVFDDPRAVRIVTGIYARIPVLWRDQPEENPWGVSFSAMLHMANDSGLFHTSDSLEAEGWHLTRNVFMQGPRRMMPLYEAKLIHHFDSRFSTYAGATQAQINKGTLPRLTPAQHADPEYLPTPRYWVDEAEVDVRLGRRGWHKSWMLGWRDISWSANERTMISCVIPRTAAPDGTLLMLPTLGSPDLLAATLSSIVFDYVVRQKSSGSHLKYFTVKQLPVLPPSICETSVAWLNGHEFSEWIRQRVLELSYTAYDLAGFATELGDDGPPFRWDEARRFAMRAELDAAFFHLYGIERDDVIYIINSFHAFENNDRARFDRTKALILEIYDSMAEAMRATKSYRTILDPPPGSGLRHPDSRSEE